MDTIIKFDTETIVISILRMYNPLINFEKGDKKMTIKMTVKPKYAKAIKLYGKNVYTNFYYPKDWEFDPELKILIIYADGESYTFQIK